MRGSLRGAISVGKRIVVLVVCREHVEALVDVERHVAGCANGPLFILRARGTIPEASSGGFVRLSILEGEEFVYAVEDWRAEEVTTSASGGDEDED